MCRFQKVAPNSKTCQTTLTLSLVKSMTIYYPTIVHIVLIKFRSDLSDEQEAEFITQACCLKEIPGVTLAIAGAQDSMYEGYANRAQGYTHCLTVHLNDRASLEAYNSHSKHIEVRDKYIVPYLDQSQPAPVLAFDYEC
jgi:hypothetical protein